MNSNKISISYKNINSSDEEMRHKIKDKIYNIKSYGFSSFEELNKNKGTSDKTSSNYCNFPTYHHINTEEKSHRNINNINDIPSQTSRNNYTIETKNINNYKKKINYKIIGDVTKIYSKVYNSKNKTRFKSIFHKEPKIVLGNKTKINENGMQNSYVKINNNREKRVTYNYGDYPRNEITYKHPQIYVLTSGNKKNNTIIRLPRINSNNLLKISRKNNFMELIPDYINNYDKYNKEKFYEYYIKKKFELKKFN